MATISLQYIRQDWYFKTFSWRGGRYLAMANKVGFPDTLMDFLRQRVWFETGATPLEACENLERKMGMTC